MIDGQGTVSGRTAAIDQALDAEAGRHRARRRRRRRSSRSRSTRRRSRRQVVGWHSGPEPGPGAGGRHLRQRRRPSRRTSRKAAASRRSPIPTARPASSCSPTTQYGIAVFKATRWRRRSRSAAAARCSNSSIRPSAKLAAHAAAHHDAAAASAQSGRIRWRSTTSISTSWGPRSQAAGIKGDGRRTNISAGDGRNPRSSASGQAIPGRHGRRAAATCRAGSCVDELNRAFAGAVVRLFRRCIRLVTADNIAYRRRRRRTCSIPTTAIATSTRRSGREVGFSFFDKADAALGRARQL